MREIVWRHFRLRPTRRWLGIYLLIASCACGPAAAFADEDQQLEAYLSRLGLVDLQLVQMNKRLAGINDKKAQQNLAKSMADLYASQLMTHADNPAKYQRLLSRVESLLEQYPSAKTTSIEVMLLQADYNRAETLAGQWVDDHGSVDARKEARAILAAITTQLASHYRSLSTQIDLLDEQMTQLEPGDELEAKTREFRRLEAIAARAQYFAAWGNYYYGLIKEARDDAEAYRQAETFFREFTGVGNDPLRPEDAEILGLDNVWRARAMIGLGITLAARGQLADSERAFQLLRNAIVSPQIQEQADYWFVRGLLNAGYPQAAVNHTRAWIRNFSGKPTQSDLSMCVALVRQAFVPDITPAVKQELIDAGMNGLARLGQTGVIRQLLDKYEIPLDDKAGFVLRAAKGKQLFDTAEKSGKAEDYEAAKKVLQAAVDNKKPDSDVKAVANATYRLAWCYFRLQELESAGQTFEEAARALQAVNDDAAVDASWMAFASYQPISKQNARFATAAVRILEGIKQDYPQHPYAAKADYHISKLMQNASPEEALKSLAAVTPADPNYLNARYDLCALLYRGWSQSKSEDRSAQANQLKAAADVYLQAANNPDEKRKLRVTLHVVEAFAGVDPNVAMTYLSQAQSIATKLPENARAVADYHYFAMRHASKQDPAAEQEHAQWLVDHTTGSRYELSALVTAARGADKALASQPQDRDALSLAHRIYSRLSARLGTSQQVLKTTKNARVAASKTASLATQLGNDAEAAALLEALAGAYPQDKNYLRRAGTAQFKTGNFAAALPHWRTLVKGSKRNSTEWHEAKYHQIACLANTDRALAKQALTQYQVLYPDGGPASLRTRFQTLRSELGQ